MSKDMRAVKASTGGQGREARSAGASELEASVAQAYARSLRLPSNPELRALLTDIYIAGRATKKQLSAIPVLTGKLSTQEQAAIEKTLSAVGQLGSSPALQDFLERGASERERYVAGLAHAQAANVRNANAGIVMGTVASVLGIAAGFALGDMGLVLASPVGGFVGGAAAVTFGFSRGGALDAKGRQFGVFD